MIRSIRLRIIEVDRGKIVRANSRHWVRLLECFEAFKHYIVLHIILSCQISAIAACYFLQIYDKILVWRQVYLAVALIRSVLYANVSHYNRGIHRAYDTFGLKL